MVFHSTGNLSFYTFFFRWTKFFMVYRHPVLIFITEKVSDISNSWLMMCDILESPILFLKLKLDFISPRRFFCVCHLNRKKNLLII